MTCPHNRIQIRNESPGVAEVMIYERIGASLWEEGVTAKQFRTDLKALGEVKTLNVRINSPGGSIAEGMAIYAALKESKAKKVMHVDGVAASMASVIAMAGDEIRIAEGGFVMIHDPYGMAEGTADELRKYAEVMDKYKSQMVAIYASRTGLSEDEVSSLMASETWMNSTEAVAKGFANKVSGKAVLSAELRLDGFKNTPQAVKDFYAEARKGACKKEPTDMADQLKNEPVPATLAELKAACEGASAEFLLAQMEAKATEAQALKAYAAQLKADAEAAKAEAAKAKASKPEPEAKAKPGVEALAGKSAKDDSPVDPRETIEALVSQRMSSASCDRQSAWGWVMLSRPDLRESLVASANARRS